MKLMTSLVKWAKRVPRILHDMPMAEWDRSNRWALLGSAVAFLALYAVDVICQPPAGVSLGIEILLNLLWVFYAVDYILTMYVAEHSWKWMSKHILGLLILVAPLIPGLRFVRVVAALYALHRGSLSWVRGHINIYIACAGALLLSTGALLVLEAERGVPGASIDNYTDALWWAFVSVTTIGYGEYYPVTAEGKLITVAVVIAGIALIGVITGACAAWVIKEISLNGDKTAPVTTAQADKIERKLEMLSDRVGELHKRMR
ncbi:ion transporter [Bifidobacterium eulemuris]|uniref:Ion transporter n=2 Tax=Bifidobacterium eulemuris TaxID=1765219 RepID=A0A261GAY9_9BIFI|nr:ion transporter [Bifidobacterium eulemuris]